MPARDSASLPDEAAKPLTDAALNVNLVGIDSAPEGGADGASSERQERGGIFSKIVPYGGLLSSSFNMASATLGAGIISLPSSYNLSGIVMATFYLITICIGTIFSMHLLAHVMVKSGLRTYSIAARELLGKGTDYFLATLIIILCFGGSVAYVMFASGLLASVLQHSDNESLTSESVNRIFTSAIWLVFMLPLVMVKRINSLRYFSTIGVIFIIFFVGCMIYHSATNGLHDGGEYGSMAWMRTGNAALEGLGSLLFAFMCQLNAFEIFHEQKKRTVFHFTLYSVISMTTCAVLYFLAGIFGYADFRGRVKDSVLVLYDPFKDPYIGIGYIGIIFKVCVAFALHMIPMRDAIYHFLNWNVETVPYWKHAIAMATPTTAALLCGLFVPTINTVLGLLGSLCGGIIGFVMPPLMFMYCGEFSLRNSGWLLYFGTYLLLCGGVISVAFGSTTTIYSTVMNNFES